MRFLQWLKLIGIGGFAAGILSIAALWIHSLVRPNRDILFIDLTLLAYLFAILTGSIGGMIISLVVLISRSPWMTATAAILVSITTTWGTMQYAAETYRNEIYFDAPMFYADVLHIFLNGLIYPAVALLLWRLTRHRSARMS